MAHRGSSVQNSTLDSLFCNATNLFETSKVTIGKYCMLCKGGIVHLHNNFRQVGPNIMLFFLSKTQKVKIFFRLLTKRKHIKRLLFLSTKQGQYIFEVGAECL